MATYVIGDVQGCHEQLLELLARVRFDPGADRLWLVGDLVNRGPASLEVLRLVRGLGAGAVAVLGNHDVHLVARALGLAARKPRDTLEEVLGAADAPQLLDWLRGRPLVHREGRFLMVHAGLLPAWTPAAAAALAREVEAALRGPAVRELLGPSRGRARRWDERLSGVARLQAALAAFTRLRTVSAAGDMALGFAGPPADAAPGQRPWFEWPHRRGRRTVVLFGHWAALGLTRGPGHLGLDSGCVWGGALTAYRLEDGALYQVPGVRR